MGGEKAQKELSFWPIMGSPPHGRGKADSEDAEDEGGRITPAWAGKRVKKAMEEKKDGDHPRMGGEKFHPRSSFINEFRITPAWAGKSQVCILVNLPIEDHPRMGGEKIGSSRRFKVTKGSPPHGRGKVIDKNITVECDRITPAWAGKRKCLFLVVSEARDHPRMGGEKAFSPLLTA